MSSARAKKPNGNPSQFFLPRRSSFKQLLVTRRKSDSTTEALRKSSNEKVPTPPVRPHADMLTPITNGRRYSAGDERRRQTISGHDRHMAFLDLPALMAAGRSETFTKTSENLSTRETSTRDTVASGSAGEPFSDRIVSKYSSKYSLYCRALDTFAAEDTNTEDGLGQNILALNRRLYGTEKSLEAKMQDDVSIEEKYTMQDTRKKKQPTPQSMRDRTLWGAVERLNGIQHHHHTCDASGLTAVPAGFGGLTSPRKRTLRKLPSLAPIKDDLPPLSAAALAAHEASFANENSCGFDVSGMCPASPRVIEKWKARQEAKRTASQLKAMLEPKLKTKEELDAEFQEVYADMEEDIKQKWLFQLHQHWAEQRLQQKRDKRDYARRNHVPFIDTILGADWNEVQGEGAGRNRNPLKAKVKEIRARVPGRLMRQCSGSSSLEARLTLVDEEEVRLDELLLLRANTCRGDDNSDSEDDFDEDSDSDFD